MTALAQNLKDQILALAVDDRAELADLLLDSLEEPRPEVETAALKEMLARWREEIDHGEVRPLSHEEFLAGLDAAEEANLPASSAR